jgi:fucose 4-O-acetylase-like acetyltransferase
MWTFPGLRVLWSFFSDKNDTRQSKIERNDIDTALMTERVLTAPIDPITAPVRSNTVDIVKGFAILLVTYEHTAQGMWSRAWWYGPSRDFSNVFVYSFHMPAFFFVAGLFVAGSIKRRGPKDFILDKSQTLLYLYLFWAILLSAIEPLISRFKSYPHPVDWKAFPVSLINGVAGWFFPVLFLCFMLAFVTIKLPAWLRCILAIIAAILMPNHGYEVFYKTVWHFSFLAGGMLVGRSIFKLSDLPRWAAILGAIAIFTAQAVVVHQWGGFVEFGTPPAWRAVTLGFTGVAGLFLLARVIENTSFGIAWAWLGQASLGIFLMAQFPQGATRQFLLSVFHTHEFWLQLLIPTAVCTLLPAIIWHQQKRWRIGWLFRWPFS